MLWRTRQGEVVNIKDVTDNHLANLIQYARGGGATYSELRKERVRRKKLTREEYETLIVLLDAEYQRLSANPDEPFREEKVRRVEERMIEIRMHLDPTLAEKMKITVKGPSGKKLNFTP